MRGFFSFVISYNGFGEWPSRPSPTTTTTTMADELDICVFQHQALFDARDKHNDRVSAIAWPS